MRAVGVLEAKTHLAALLGEVERGGEILITRHGRPVARLGPAGASGSGESGRRAAAALRAASRGKTLGGVPIRSLIDEGRR